ncbi:MAG: hypothetical protein J5947_08505 [Clostridium sp.]|nr:hypothetical protein [Clostridium sp.]MBO6150225.1 hypothetical protein [Clostridium sp.]
MNKKEVQKGAALVFTGFGAMMFLSSRMIPKIADDYPFSFVWDGDTHGNLAFGDHVYRRVRTAGDLVRSQVSHYMTWSGRTIAETLNQLVLMKDDKLVYDSVNTGVILTQLLTCLWAGRGKVTLKDIPTSLAAMLSAGYWFCTPTPTVTALWTTGACNYSWMGLLQSGYLLPWALQYHHKEYSVPAPVMFPAGIFAGWSNEAGGGLALAASAAASLRALLRGEKAGWMAAGLAGAAAGYGLLMLAPGNFRRMKIEEEYSDILPTDFSDPSNVPTEYRYTPKMFAHYLKNSFASVILRELPLQIPVILYLQQKENHTKETSDFIAAMEGACMAVPCLLMLSPEFPKRAAYPGVLYLMTAAVKAFDSIDKKPFREWGKAAKLSAVLAGGALAVNYLASVFVDADVYMQTEEQIRRLKNAEPGETVTVPDIMLSPFWTKLAGDRTIDEYIKDIIRFEEDPEDCYNKAAAAYYGADAMKSEIPKAHPYLRKDREALKAQVREPVRNFLRRLRK